MSNFPIIATTPPPLDIEIDGTEEEDEPDFRTFNDISPEEEKDIDFVVPDFSPEKETEEQISNNKIKFSYNKSSEESNIKSVEEDINTDSGDNNNDFEIKTVSEKDFEIVRSVEDFQIDTDLNTNENIDLDSNQNHSNDKTTEMSTEDKERVVEEFNDFNCVNNNLDENDLDFADFTSYKFSEENFKQNKDILEETHSLSFYNSDKSFGDFRDNNNIKTNFNTINDSQSNENSFNDNESDDDFADFASAQPVLKSDTDFKPVSNFKSNFCETIESDKKEGFADFSSFEDNKQMGFTDNIIIASNIVLTQESNKLTELFARVFPTQESIDSIENSPNISRDLFNSAEQNSKTIWKQLQDLESAPSLKLRWPTSHSFQLLLTALNIDPRNILRNPSVPVFASGLGCVLEPTKHNINSDLSDDTELENTNGFTSNTIPPVQFDWSSSGLTNPLDANKKSMIAFDLDFFVTNEDVKNSHKQTDISNIEEELLNHQIDKNLEYDSVVLDTNKNKIMEQILSTVGNTSSISIPQTNGNQVLTAEALQVLDELPNLSFLRAKVLMFPLISKQIQTHK